MMGAPNRSLRPVTRFLILFPLLIVVLFTLELYPPIERTVIHPFTEVLADVSVALVVPFDDDAYAVGREIRSRSTGKAISIERGCNGVEAVIVLIAALVAFPSGWRQKAVGLVLGFLAIQALNLVRIVSLYYLNQWSVVAFEWFHQYIWQALIILDALLVWLVWLRWIGRRQTPRSEPDGMPDPA